MQPIKEADHALTMLYTKVSWLSAMTDDDDATLEKLLRSLPEKKKRHDLNATTASDQRL